MTVNTMRVSPRDVPPILDRCRRLGFSAMLWGAPGVGKTSCVHDFAARIGGSLHDVRLTQIESVDLRGLCIPDRGSGTTVWLRPEFLPAEGEGVIFLDELTHAEERLQASAYSLLLERRVGSYRVPDGYLVAAAGNRVEDGAIAREMGTALADRLVHVQIEADPESWAAWAQAAGVAPEVIAFVRVRPDLLETSEARQRAGHLIGASPRGWERVSRIVRDLADPADRRTRDIMIAGVVGESAAAEFAVVLSEIGGQVAADAVLAAERGAMGAMLPRTIAGLYAFAYALPRHVGDLAAAAKAAQACLELDAVAADRPGLPVEETRTLAMELCLQRVLDLGLMPAFVRTPEYAEYAAGRERMKRAAAAQ